MTHAHTNPYEADHKLRSCTQIVRSILACCFGSLFRTTTSGAIALFLFASFTTMSKTSSSSWSPRGVVNSREIRSFGIFPVVVVESAFEIDPDGLRRDRPSRFSVHADPIQGICFLGAVTLLSLTFSLILFPFWRCWAV